MTDIIEAIITAYKANGTLMGLTTGSIFQGTADRATFDYVTLSTTNAQGGDPTYAGHQLGEGIITFSVWSTKGGAVAVSTAKAIRDVFKGTLLTLSQGTILNVNVARPVQLFTQQKRGANGESIVMASFDLRYSTEMF